MRLATPFGWHQSGWAGRGGASSRVIGTDREFSPTRSFYSNTANKQPPVFTWGSSTFIQPGNWPISQRYKYPTVELCRFQSLDSFVYSEHRMASEIAYLALISHLDKLVQPSNTLCTQIKPLTHHRACYHTCQLRPSEWQRWLRAISTLLNWNV